MTTTRRSLLGAIGALIAAPLVALRALGEIDFDGERRLREEMTRSIEACLDSLEDLRAAVEELGRTMTPEVIQKLMAARDAHIRGVYARCRGEAAP